MHFFPACKQLTTNIINYFNESYGITISGFDNKDIFSLQATFSGYDDMLKEFPEIMHTLKRIEYNPRIKSYGKYIENYTSLVGYSGLKSYGTGVHEATHALEFYRSKGKEKRYAETLLDKARKELGFTKRSKEFKSLATRVCSDPDIATYDIELIAYCMEHEKGNVSNKLTRKVYELIKENNL